MLIFWTKLSLFSIHLTLGSIYRRYFLIFIAMDLDFTLGEDPASGGDQALRAAGVKRGLPR